MVSNDEVNAIYLLDIFVYCRSAGGMYRGAILLASEVQLVGLYSYRRCVDVVIGIVSKRVDARSDRASRS